MPAVEYGLIIPHNEFSVDHALAVLPHWHWTSYTLGGVEDFTIALDLDKRGLAAGQDLKLNNYVHHHRDKKKAITFGELRDGRWTDSLNLVDPQMITLKPNEREPERGELVFDSESLTYEVSKGGLIHTLFERQSGEKIASLYFDQLVSERSIADRIRAGRLTWEDKWEIDRNYRERNKTGQEDRK